MIWATLYFCCGITFAYFFRMPFWLIISCAFTLLITCLISLKKDLTFKILLPCLIFTLGALFFKNTYILPKSHISRFILYKNDTVFTVKGFINSQPQLKDGRLLFLFRTQELEFYSAHYKCSGDILVHLKGAGDLAYGEAFVLRGSLHRPFKLYNDSISAIMRVNSSSCAVSLGKNCAHPLIRLAYFLRNRVEAIIQQRLSRLAAGILEAMVLGEKSDIPPVIYDSMSKTGTVHILVVSGFNVGVVAFIIMLLLKILRVPRVLRYITTISCLVIYCFATGASSPVVRATVMAIFFLAGFLISREPDIGNSLSLAALFILLVNPRELFSISFQLSFVALRTIIFLYPRLKVFSKAGDIKIRAFKVHRGRLPGFSICLARNFWIYLLLF